MTINNVHTHTPGDIAVTDSNRASDQSQPAHTPRQGPVSNLIREGQTLAPPQGVIQGESHEPRTRYQSIRELISNLNPLGRLSSRFTAPSNLSEVADSPMLSGLNRHSERYQVEDGFFSDSSRFESFRSEGVRAFSSRFESSLRFGPHYESGSYEGLYRGGDGRELDLESSRFSGASNRVLAGSNFPSGRSDFDEVASRPRRQARLETIQSIAPPQGIELRDREIVSSLKPLAGPDGHFFFPTPEGGLYRYDPTVNEILPTGLGDVKQLTLGADRAVYALKGNTVSRLDTNATLSNPVPLGLNNDIDLNIRDLAVSKTGVELFFITGSGSLFVKDVSNTEPARHLVIPFDMILSAPHSVATASDGGVFLQGANSEVWYGKAPVGGGYDNLTWTSLSFPPEHLTRLETLPDGSVAGRTADGRYLRPESQPNNRENPAVWKSVPLDSLSKTSFEVLHEAMRKPSGAELITLGQSLVNIRPFDPSTFRQPLENLKEAVKGIPQKFRDVKNFSYSNQQAHTLSSYDAQVRMLKNQLEGVASNLVMTPDTVRQQVHERFGADISLRTETFLARLPTGNGETAASTSENGVLSQIRDVRRAVYGEEDHLVQQLTQAIQQGRTTQIEAPPHGGKLAELIADYAILGTAVFHLTENGPLELEERQAILDGAMRFLDQSLPHLVTRSGIDETDPFGRAAEGFDSLQSILRQPGDVVTRLTREKAAAMGETVPSDATMKDLTPLLQKAIDSMKPGDNISLGKNKNDGFNTETLRLVLSGAIKTLSGGLDDLVAWAIPIFDKGKLKNVELAISKTDKGIALTVEQSESRYLQGGMRAGTGLVAIPANMKEKGVTWGFAGIEFAGKVKHTDQTADSITLNFKDQGNGNLARLVNSVLSGQASLFELMRQSDKIDSSLVKESGWNVNVGGVLVGASGTDQPGWKSINERVGVPGFEHAKGSAINAVSVLQSTGKALGAGVLEGTADFSGNSSTRQTRSSSGEASTTQARQNFGLDNFRINGIGVGVLESDFAKFPLPGDMKKGPGLSAPTLTTRAGLPGVLPGFIIGKTFEGFAPVSQSATISYAEDGTANGIDVRLTIKNMSKLFTELDPEGELLQTVPGLKKALGVLNGQDKVNPTVSTGPVRVSLTLKPGLMSPLPAEPNQRKAELEHLAKDRNNFRITELSASYSNEAKHSTAVNIPGWTREVGGFVKTSTDSAKVQFLYDKTDLLEKGKGLVDELSRFDDGSWGTTARQTRLTGLMHQLENIVDALAQSPVDSHGEDLRKGIESDKNQVKAKFLVEVRKMLTGRVEPRQRDELVAKFEQLSTDIDSLRQKHFLPPFEGPAILTSGSVFVKTDVGRITEDLRPGYSSEISVDRALGSLDKIARLDLSSKTGTALEEAKFELNKEMDNIKRTLNTMTDLDSSWKEDFFVELSVFAARPDYQRGRELQDRLQSLNPNHD